MRRASEVAKYISKVLEELRRTFEMMFLSPPVEITGLNMFEEKYNVEIKIDGIYFKDASDA